MGKWGDKHIERQGKRGIKQGKKDIRKIGLGSAVGECERGECGESTAPTIPKRIGVAVI